MSEEEVVNRFLNMIATEYDGGLAIQFKNQYILRYKEIKELQQENKQLKSILTEIENMCKEEYYERNTIDIDSIVLSSHLDARIYLKIKELKEKYK